MKTFIYTCTFTIFVALLFIITTFIGTRTPKVEYHIELINDSHVKLYDEDYKLLKTIQIDSIGYYLIEDNI